MISDGVEVPCRAEEMFPRPSSEFDIEDSHVSSTH